MASGKKRGALVPLGHRRPAEKAEKGAARKTARENVVRETFAQPSTADVMGDDELRALDLDAPISRKDAERILRRTKLICRGPISDARRADVVKLLAKGKNSEARALEAQHRGVKLPGSEALDVCGFDYTQLILDGQHPLDGSEMAYTCPRCGVTGTIRPARFNIK